MTWQHLVLKTLAVPTGAAVRPAHEEEPDVVVRRHMAGNLLASARAVRGCPAEDLVPFGEAHYTDDLPSDQARSKMAPLRTSRTSRTSRLGRASWARWETARHHGLSWI